MSNPSEISNVIKLQIANYKERAKMQETGKVIWYSPLFKNFPQFVVIHIVKVLV